MNELSSLALFAINSKIFPRVFCFFYKPSHSTASIDRSKADHTKIRMHHYATPPPTAEILFIQIKLEMDTKYHMASILKILVY